MGSADVTPDIEQSIEIAALAETVWAVTTDVERWPEWTVKHTTAGIAELVAERTQRLRKRSPLEWCRPEVEHRPPSFIERRAREGQCVAYDVGEPCARRPLPA